MKLTLDIIFSNWIFLWFLLFCFGLIKYNPLFIFVIIFIICNSIIIYIYYTNKLDNYNLLKLIILNFLFKFIPIIILISINYNIYNNDLLFTIFLILIYLVYIQINNLNVIDIYYTLLKGAYTNDENLKGFMSKLYDYLYTK